MESNCHKLRGIIYPEGNNTLSKSSADHKDSIVYSADTLNIFWEHPHVRHIQRNIAGQTELTAVGMAGKNQFKSGIFIAVIKTRLM